MDERTSEPERYDTAAGWQPRDPHKLARERARREYDLTPGPAETMLAVRKASKWIASDNRRPPAELLVSLWRQGEIAVMFGERGSGKSVFAVQIADALAKGKSPLNTPQFDTPRSRRKKGEPPLPSVLYIDFELSDRQFTARYYRRDDQTKSARKPRFAFDRAMISADHELPEGFRNASEFLSHSIQSAIVERPGGIVIIDSIHYLLRNGSSSLEALNLMKTLRGIAAEYNVSLLITAPMHPRSNSTRPVTIKDLAAHRYVAEFADTVFALCHSTLGPTHRYIKHLASRHAPIEHDATRVLAFELAEGPTSQVQGPKSEDGSSKFNVQSSTLEDLSPMSQVQGPTSDAPTPSLLPSSTPESPTPPLLSSSTPHSPSLTFLAPTPELPHITDYAARAARDLDRQDRDRTRQQRLHNRSRKTHLIESILDGSFHRYLKGE